MGTSIKIYDKNFVKAPAERQVDTEYEIWQKAYHTVSMAVDLWAILTHWPLGDVAVMLKI